ncbi:hypothetical protein FQN49_006515 [Arthroderma sp. PD_2]|nr:hypothetical protein FQN49_006515 [Arthroderma sp. PD_2]
METSTSPTTVSPLEQLPWLVLDLVCEYLADIDSRRRNLFAFSLTSRRCCYGADSQRFRYIRIAVSGRGKLHRDMEQLSEILGVERRWRHVRRVKIIGRMPLAGQVEGEENEIEVALPLSVIDPEEGDEEGKRFRYGYEPPSSFFVPREFSIEEETEQHNEAWFPLALFIAQLPGLKDLIYACPDQIPRCILSTLHQHHPNSRLHISHFLLRSLSQPRGGTPVICPDDLALATSPCLYSITVPNRYYYSQGWVNYDEEAALQMVAASAPRLRIVNMWNYYEDRPYSDSPPPSPWRGSFIDIKRGLPASPRTIGCLQRLVLLGPSIGTFPSGLARWTSHNDFSKLQCLGLGFSMIFQRDIQALTRMAENGEFRSLHTLGLDTSYTFYPCVGGDRVDIDDATSLLLQNLPPLKVLKLRWPAAEKTFSAILDHHRTLCELRFALTHNPSSTLKPYLISSEHVRKLQQNCPNLQEVTLQIPRTRGNEQEVQIYQAVGGLRRLKRASLYLDCQINDCTRAYDDCKLTPSIIRDSLLNAAVDSSLALSIFRAISSASASASSNHRSTFQHLRLLTGTRALERRPGLDLETAMAWVGRSWACTRDPREGHETEVIVEEIRKKERLEISEKIDRILARDNKACPGCRDIWSELWSLGTGDLKENWSSVPLAEEGISNL